MKKVAREKVVTSGGREMVASGKMLASEESVASARPVSLCRFHQPQSLPHPDLMFSALLPLLLVD
jgi:hypothetical protein